LVGLAGQNTRDDKPEEAGITLAGIEKRASEQLFQLLEDGLFFRFVRRRPAFYYLLW
jgi:hypothetical protein